MTDQTEYRRWICSNCQSRIILEEACFSGILPDETTMCDVCGAIGSFELNFDAEDSVEQKALDAYWNARGPAEEIAAMDRMVELGMMRDRADIDGMAKAVSTLHNRRIR